MEAIKDQAASAAAAAANGSKLRYPLRSASKLKDELPTESSSASKRGRPAASNVSKSVSVLDLSTSKDKAAAAAAKPPRRLSIPTKSSISSPLPRTATTSTIITPISEARVKRSTNNGQGKNGTPGSEVSKSMINQRKFSVLSSASYWLSQIKLSESAAKHSISVGFFKLALESGCEPLQRLRDELKSYARRHNNLIELGESVKELLKSYNIVEDDLEQLLLQVSETCSQVPEGTQSTEEDVHSSSTTAARRLKPKSLNTESFQSSTVVVDSAKENTKKKKVIPKKNMGPSVKNSTDFKSVTGNGGTNNNIQKQKKTQRSTRQNTKKEKIQNQEKKTAEETAPVELLLPTEETQQEDKENMDAQQMEEISLTEVII